MMLWWHLLINKLVRLGPLSWRLIAMRERMIDELRLEDECQGAIGALVDAGSMSMDIGMR